MNALAVIVKNIDRPDRGLVESFAKIGIATIHESMGKEMNTVMHHSIRPIRNGMKLLGAAVTVDSFPADNLTLHVGMTLCKKGDVLVVNGHGIPGVMFGAQMAFQCIQHGVAGIVVDGAVRDSEELVAMGFPTFAKIISPLGSAKSTPGSVNVPVQCGGVLVNPGDIIVGDDDGVVVIPRTIAAETLERSKVRLTKEEKAKQEYARGKTSMELNEFEKILKARGVREVDSLEDL